MALAEVVTETATADEKTVGGALIRAADLYASFDALVFDGRRATYCELLDEATRCAASLLGMAVERGDHVGILMPNCWDAVVLVYACNLIGAPAVLLNSRYREDDLSYVIPASDISLLVIGGHAHEYSDYRSALQAIFPELSQWDGKECLSLGHAPKIKTIVELGESRPGSWPQEAEFNRAADGVDLAAVNAAAAAITPDDVSLIMFSSGTTSRPKACMLLHRSLCATGQALSDRFRLTSHDRVLDPLPLFHMSTMLPMAACRSVGACFVGMGHFNADAAMSLLKEERITVNYAGFPTIVSAITAHPDFKAWDQSDLRINHVVGPPDLLRRYQQEFPQAVLVNGYGLTEATGVPCYSDLDDSPVLLCETNGRLFDGMNAMIADADTGQPVENGLAGEIRLKGYCLFAGYYNDPVATAAAISDDGWLRTGDLGRIGPGGRLIYDGRLKDMLKIGGENVAAVELESFLMTHSAVRMAQVISVPDDHLMEVAAAFIEVHEGQQIDENDLVHHCLGKIATYKIPRYIRFVLDWPMSATKVQKFKLRQDFIPTGMIDVTVASKGIR